MGALRTRGRRWGLLQEMEGGPGDSESKEEAKRPGEAGRLVGTRWSLRGGELG